MKPCTFVLVGYETLDNLRLSQLLKHIYGGERVVRLLDLRHLEPFLAGHRDSPIVVCLDLLGFDLGKATETVGRVRDSYPKVVFNLYLDFDDYQRRVHHLPGNWRDRFQHYHKTYKEPADVEFEPIVRGSLAPSEEEALYNVSGVEPVRFTSVAVRGLVRSAPGPSLADRPTAFLSYARSDWEGFVSRLVSDLAAHSLRVWIDQSYIEGGDDWMDAVGNALQACDTLLLVLSPDAISSKWVKAEYRYFVRQNKPIIPILYRRVEPKPFELAGLHYIDFTQGDSAKARSTLFEILSRKRVPDRRSRGREPS